MKPKSSQFAFPLTRSKILVVISLLMFIISSCKNETFKANFNNCNDRVWVGEKFWAVPLEDWRIQDSRIECVGNRENMRVNLLTTSLSGNGSAEIQLITGLTKKSENPTCAGISIGLKDETDNSIKSLCYFGSGTDIGISTNGYIFIGQLRKELPGDFDYSRVQLTISAKNKGEENEALLSVKDEKGQEFSLEDTLEEDISGGLALFNKPEGKKGQPSQFWFDDLSISGSLVKIQEDNKFGPVLWPMYTLSRNVLKMSAQFPPLGEKDNKTVQLEIKEKGKWTSIATAEIDEDAYSALFRVENWDSSNDYEYRLVYNDTYKDGSSEKKYYQGVIRKDPGKKELTIGALTCQFTLGFPYTPLVANLGNNNPDLLYFSGDQVYEPNGGYGIIRSPEDRAMLNYLGKWYMFGWAFGDLMRNRPTVCLPDDHDVFQGNLWGNGGTNISFEDWEKQRDCTGGFVQTPKFVNMVMRTNCSHLPDPFDPTPMEQGISVYYTDMVYGRVSFAIVGDRAFKSGPERVKSPKMAANYYRGYRLDMLINPVKDLSVLDKPGLKFLGDRQMKFIDHWVEDWKGADMKVLLSQTLFANNTTHYGFEKSALYADLDSGGWPKSARDKAVNKLKKCATFHICGDQHLASMIQYGTRDYRDAGWAYCNPAITVIYPRRFLPDTLGREVVNRPEHQLPNTGYYTDGFGNPSYLYAVGNPDDNANAMNRYQRAEQMASGYGLVAFDKMDRTITAHTYHFLSKLTNNPADGQFPGWPHTISQFDNLGAKNSISLPELKVSGCDNPIVKVFCQESGELVMAVRIKGQSFTPKVEKKGLYKILVGNDETDVWKSFNDIEGVSGENGEIIVVDF